MISRRIAGPALLAVLAVLQLYTVGCGDRASGRPRALPFYGDADLTPQWISDPEAREAIHRIAPFSLTDQLGMPFTEGHIDGKVVVADFFFAGCPTLCPRLARSMRRIQDSTAGDGEVLLLSFSVTPELDSAPVLARYARHVGADDARWRFLTGRKSTIYDLARSSCFAKVDTGEDAFLHTETFYLIDRSRRIRGIYNGTLAADVTRLIEDLRQLRREEE